MGGKSALATVLRALGRSAHGLSTRTQKGVARSRPDVILNDVLCQRDACCRRWYTCPKPSIPRDKQGGMVRRKHTLKIELRQGACMDPWGGLVPFGIVF